METVEGENPLLRATSCSVTRVDFGLRAGIVLVRPPCSTKRAGGHSRKCNSAARSYIKTVEPKQSIVYNLSGDLHAIFSVDSFSPASGSSFDNIAFGTDGAR